MTNFLDLIKSFELRERHEEVNLPSGRILHVRPLDGNDEKDNLLPSMILKRCVKEEISDLSEHDKLFLSVWIMGVSYGTKKNVCIRCPEGHEFMKEIDLDEVPIDDFTILAVCPYDAGEFEINIADFIWHWSRIKRG